jgi:hypothetical protein
MIMDRKVVRLFANTLRFQCLSAGLGIVINSCAKTREAEAFIPCISPGTMA